MNTVLMIAFHYPPYQGSSGTLRTLSFSRYLPEFGWRPIVLTAVESVYGRISTGPGALSPPEHVVLDRAYALDAARDLSIIGRYPGIIALPDRWVSWSIHAVWRALRLIRRYRPSVVWSTYPIATAHLIGRIVHGISGTPWIADFRDSMTEENYPEDSRQRRAYRAIERSTVRASTRVVFTTSGTRAMYAARYEDVPDSKWTVIANGFDEEVFAAVEPAIQHQQRPNRPLVLLHSGVLYPVERDPQPFLAAVQQLKAKGAISASTLAIRLRATSHDDVIRPMIKNAGVDDIVRLEPPIPYREALLEMLQVDGLLLFQAANCNHQIPAKLYEYMRSGRPIFALTDPRGDTAASLRAAGIGLIADLASKTSIECNLEQFIRGVRAGTAATVRREYAERYSRRGQAAELAQVLADILAG